MYLLLYSLFYLFKIDKSILITLPNPPIGGVPESCTTIPPVLFKDYSSAITVRNKNKKMKCLSSMMNIGYIPLPENDNKNNQQNQNHKAIQIVKSKSQNDYGLPNNGIFQSIPFGYSTKPFEYYNYPIKPTGIWNEPIIMGDDEINDNYTTSTQPLLSPYRPNVNHINTTHDFMINNPIYISIKTNEIYEMNGIILSIYQCDEDTHLEIDKFNELHSGDVIYLKIKENDGNYYTVTVLINEIVNRINDIIIPKYIPPIKYSMGCGKYVENNENTIVYMPAVNVNLKPDYYISIFLLFFFFSFSIFFFFNFICFCLCKMMMVLLGMVNCLVFSQFHQYIMRMKDHSYILMRILKKTIMEIIILLVIIIIIIILHYNWLVSIVKEFLSSYQKMQSYQHQVVFHILEYLIIIISLYWRVKRILLLIYMMKI